VALRLPLRRIDRDFNIDARQRAGDGGTKQLLHRRHRFEAAIEQECHGGALNAVGLGRQRGQTGNERARDLQKVVDNGRACLGDGARRPEERHHCHGALLRGGCHGGRGLVENYVFAAAAVGIRAAHLAGAADAALGQLRQGTVA
jgi:hypothetical protein